MPLTDHDQSLSDYINQFLDKMPEDYDPKKRGWLYSSHDVLLAMLKRFDNNYTYFDIGLGWIPILLNMDRKLSLISPNYTISQVKEKFGGLRFYADFKCPAGLSSTDSNILYEIFYDLIHLTEASSLRTCDVCSGDGRAMTTNGGYIVTRCDQHRP